MTAIQSNFNVDHSTDAGFRAWGAAVSAGLAACGLVKTTDTGQADWTSSGTTRPGSMVNSGPYEIWRFTDALQATCPVFIKINYGTGSSSGPQIWITVGSGTNGAGTITGVSTTQLSVGYTNYTSVTSPSPSYFSSDGSFLTMAITCGPPAPTCMAVVVVDRTRNADGTANSDGLYIVVGGGINSVSACNTLVWNSNIAGRSWASGTNAAFPADAPNRGTGVYALDVDVYPHPVYAPRLEPGPASACVGIYASDIQNGTVFPVTHLGATHYFLALGGYTQFFGWYSINGSNSTPNFGHNIAIRYE